MEIELLNSKTIGEVQAEFMAKWPYVKPVFFTRSHRAFRGSNAKFIINDRTLTLGQIRKAGQADEGWLYLDDETIVLDLEKMFEEDFGLHVQIFRKSGDRWLETSVTDNLSLAEQNQRGEESANFTLPVDEPMDYREQD